ncbi:MAG TPA: hypothetical protein ENK18_20345 [Deltaproteobacteria bacterium]|nr:hypothetical protein [Deltaproteobacteria bacterium]
MDTDLSCREACEAANDLLDGLLPVVRAEEVQAHLRGCVACRTYTEQLQTTVQLLQRLEPLPASVEGQAQLMETFQAWHSGRAAEPETLWQRCLARRHWAPALRLSALIFPVLLVVNHSMCILHMKLGMVCLGQSLLIAIFPFLVALYSSARTEHLARPGGL